jgi:hypothetical protein
MSSDKPYLQTLTLFDEMRSPLSFYVSNAKPKSQRII